MHPGPSLLRTTDVTQDQIDRAVARLEKTGEDEGYDDHYFTALYDLRKALRPSALRGGN